MRKQAAIFLTIFIAMVWHIAPSHAAFLIEPPVGLGIGSSNFSFGGDTTSYRLSGSKSYALGLYTPNSIYGGDGVNEPDTYLYSYTPGVDGDNRPITQGLAMNDDGDTSSGMSAGESGTYKVYATWPQSTNVDGGPTLYELDGPYGTLFSVTVDQNEDAGYQQHLTPGGDGNMNGNEWYCLGTVTLDASETYVLKQQPTQGNTYVSMRSDGVLFDLVPEPTSAAVLIPGMILMWSRK